MAVSVGKQTAKYSAYLTLPCQTIFVPLCLFLGLAQELKSQN